MKNPTPIMPTAEGPINDLAFALDHYFVLGEQLGEGAGSESTDGQEWIIFLVVNPNEPADVQDFKRVKLRLAEIAQKDGISTRIERMGQDPRFTIYWLRVAKKETRDLCRHLMAGPGSAGWGGFYSRMSVLDQEALRIARYAGVALQSVQPATPAAIRLDLAGIVPPEVLEVGLNPTGEDGRPVQFWHVKGSYYLYDPTFTDHPVDFTHLAYDPEIGLIERQP